MPIHPDVPLLPEILNSCNYQSHLVGKWHLGHYNRKYWPTNRGFHSFSGYLVGAEDYYMHHECWKAGPVPCGFDYRENERPAAVDPENANKYSAELWPGKIEKIIDNHDFSIETGKSLFMYYALQNVHWPIEVPEKYLKDFGWIKDRTRRTYYGMVKALDDSIGKVIEIYKKKGIFENTIIIFTSDNGGHHSYGGNNFPLKGEKTNVWQGGVRTTGFITGPGVKSGKRYRGLYHVTDWMPTLLGLLQCSRNGTDQVDGVDHSHVVKETSKVMDNEIRFESETLDSKKFPNVREEILVNIDPLIRSENKDNRTWIQTSFDIQQQAALIYKNWKIITGWAGPNLTYIPPEWSLNLQKQEQNYQNSYHVFKNVETYEKNMKPHPNNNFRSVQLFNIFNDPGEENELSDDYHDITNLMLKKLEKYEKIMVPPNPAPSYDPRSDPVLHNNYWDSWVED